MSQRSATRHRLRGGLAGLAAGALVASALAVVAAAPAHAAGASGRAYVTNFAADTVSVIDVASQSIVNTIAVGNGPQGIAVNPAGTFAYAVNQLAGTVSVINTSTNTVSATITTGGTPSYAIVNSAGTRLYVTDQANTVTEVYVIDTGTNSVQTINAPAPVQAYGLALNPANTFLYVAIANGAGIHIIDTSTNTIAAAAVAGLIPTDTAYRPGATEVWVPNNGGSSVTVLAAGPPTTIMTPFGPYFVDFDAAGTRAYVSHSVGQISVIDTLTKTVLTTVAVGGDPWTPKVDPSNTNLWVVNNPLNQVQIMSLASNTIVSTIGGFSQPRDIAFGPAATGADISVGVSAQFLNILSPALQFTLTATNNGPDPVSSATLTASIPAGVTATNLSSGCTQSGASIACTFGAIAIGASAQKSFSLPTALLTIGTVGVTATRTASTPSDPNPANDTGSDSCLVVSIILAIC
jgi:YVTN family beta-propeller protein